MNVNFVAKIEGKLRPFLTKLPPSLVVKIYSNGRDKFLKNLSKQLPDCPYDPPVSLSRTLWGIKFRSPIMNAAGMFKNGDGYELSAMQGAGAFLGGTGTFNPRKGNSKDGFKLPFVPYPSSGSSSNWLGLPNDGDEVNAKKVKNFKKLYDTPIGWSVMGSPDFEGEERLKYLVKSMKLYEDAGVDFLEINESCPNTAHGKPQDDDLANRLEYIKINFLDKRSRNLPVVVKFSTDTELTQIPDLMKLLFELGFDGVNFGNTSTKYPERRKDIVSGEKKLFDFYIGKFGGGISGRPLKKDSLKLACEAVKYLHAHKPKQEFHVFRTGGIENLEDVHESEKAGISMNQWYTGYFENFSVNGHEIYKKLFE